MKSAAGTEHRHALLAGQADGCVNRLVVAVRRARQHPQAVEAVDPASLLAVGGDPAQLDAVGREAHRRVDLAVSEVAEIAVAQRGNAHWPFSDLKHLDRTLGGES
jgi:hypothetical protein